MKLRKGGKFLAGGFGEVGGCRRLRTVGKDNTIGEVSSTEHYGFRDVGGWLGGSGGKRSMWVSRMLRIGAKGRQERKVGQMCR